MFSYIFGSICDKGDARAENQDSILCLSGLADGKEATLFIVADGMGGLSYGSQVSRYITEQFERWWYEDFAQLIQEEMDQEENIRELLEQEIWDINQTVLQFNHEQQCRSGSTLSLMLFYQGRYYIENIGDSRVYQFRNGRLRQLTQDQSMAAKLVREHSMTEEEARHSRMKNVLTMCVGMFDEPQSGYSSGSICSGDFYLICSDGFYNGLEYEQIAAVLASEALHVQAKADHLRYMIGPGQADDNVSVIVAEVEEILSTEFYR